MRKVSHSETKEFQRCRRKWWLNSIRGLAPVREKKTGAMSIGNRVHRSLETLYDQGVDAMWAEFNNDSDAEFFTELMDGTLVPDPEMMKAWVKDTDMCRAMLEGYIEWREEIGSDEDYEILESESIVEIPFNEDVLIIGKLDQLVRRRSDGAILFRDFKTVQDFSKTRLLPIDSQMLHYHMLLLMREFAKPVEEQIRADGALYLMLRKSKRTARATPPFYQEEEVRHNMEELRSYWLRITQIIVEMLVAEEKLENGLDHRSVVYPNPTKDCSWDCPFLPVCGMLDDPTKDAEYILRTSYYVRDPLSRYSVTHESKGDE